MAKYFSHRPCSLRVPHHTELWPYQVRRRKWLVKHVNEDLCPARGYISPWGGTERRGGARGDRLKHVLESCCLIDTALCCETKTQERRTTLHVCSERDDESTKAFILRVWMSWFVKKFHHFIAVSPRLKD